MKSERLQIGEGMKDDLRSQKECGLPLGKEEAPKKKT